jgi:hypothetical protein
MRRLTNMIRAVGRVAAHLSSRQPYKTVLMACLAIFVGFCIGLSALNSEIFAHSNEKNISLGPRSLLKPQIEILEAQVGGKSKIFDEDFEEDSDWLRRTSIEIKNVSAKPVVFLRINVWFPETTSSGPIMVYPLAFGQRPKSKLHTHAPPLMFMPDETIKISLESKYDEISRFVGERHLIESLKRIRLEVSFIVFDDETAWSVGTFMTQDPQNPELYVPVPQPPVERKP